MLKQQKREIPLAHVYLNRAPILHMNKYPAVNIFGIGYIMKEQFELTSMSGNDHISVSLHEIYVAAVKCTEDLLTVYRLKQIIIGINLVAVYGKIRRSGNEYDAAFGIKFAYFMRSIHAAHIRHIYVKKYNVVDSRLKVAKEVLTACKELWLITGNAVCGHISFDRFGKKSGVLPDVIYNCDIRMLALRLLKIMQMLRPRFKSKRR